MAITPHPAPREASGLVGIARLAAESPELRSRADVQYFALAARSTLNRESSGRMPFAWTINPYRGCEFGCKYCYARYTYEFMEMWDGNDFERKIYAKVSAPELLRAELRKARDRGLPIALGTATDPYQPAEKQFEITRRMLEVCADFEGLDFSITTKSVLILRDLDLLRAVSRRHRFSVHMTVTTTDKRLARLLEPKAPPPAKRLEAIAEYAARLPFQPWRPPSPSALKLLAVARRLEDLTEMHAAEKNRLHAASLSAALPSILRRDVERGLQTLERAVERLTRVAQEFIAADPPCGQFVVPCSVITFKLCLTL